MRSSFAILLIVFWLGSSDAKIESKCPHQRTLDADKCAKQGFFLLDDEFEGHDGDISHYCGQVKTSLTCIEKFNSECLKGFTKQAATMGIKGMKKHYKQVCEGNPPPLKQEFTKKTKWLKKPQVNQLSPCVQASIKNMNFISDKVQSNEQIPQSCCNYVITRNCLKSRVKKMTSSENQQFIETMANDALSSMINFLCSNYDTKKECDAKLKQPMERMRGLFKNPGPKEQFESYLIPFLNVLSD